jgi:hypothetical protein
MKKLLKILAWLGLLLVFITLPLSFSSSDTLISTGELGTGVGYAITGLASVIAIVLILICGIVTQTRYLWIGTIAAGVLSLISFYGYYIEPDFPIHKILIPMAPGILLVVEGIWLKMRQRRRKTEKPY